VAVSYAGCGKIHKLKTLEIFEENGIQDINMSQGLMRK
jgi:hypothetical protein